MREQEINDSFLEKYLVSQGYTGSDKQPLTKPSVMLLAALSTDILAKGGFGDVVQKVVIHLIEHMLPLDWLLFLSEKWYREHKCHQLRVASLAVWLLNELFPTQNTFNGQFGEHSKESLVGALWASAMLHDHGYALSRMARLRSVLAAENQVGTGLSCEAPSRRFENLRACYEGLFATSLGDRFCVACDSNATAEEINNQLDTEVKEMLREFLGTEAVGLDDKFLDRLCMCNLYDHGIWSAANLSATLCQFGLPWAYLSIQERNAIQTVIHAMAIHNRKDFAGEDFNMCESPVAGILLLADELQEWNRRAVPDTSPLDIGCRVTVGFCDQGNMVICFIYPKNDLAKAGYSCDTVKDWKEDAIKRRIVGAKGLPQIKLSVRAES